MKNICNISLTRERIFPKKSLLNRAFLVAGALVFLFPGLFLSGCREVPQKESSGSEATIAEEFSLGIVPERNIFVQKERYEPLAEYLSEKMGIKVVLRPFISYENVIEEIQSKNLNGAFLGSFTGAVALKKIGAIPLVRPEYPDGSSTYHGLLFTRKDSNIRTAADMKGKTFAFVDKATTAGWLLPLHYFKKNKIDDPLSWLGEIYFTGTHEDAIRDVVNGKADIGAAKDSVFTSLARSDTRITDELTILATSPPVPSNSLFVCPETADAFRDKLKETLLLMHRDKEGMNVLHALGAAKFIETTENDFEPVFSYADTIGLDLAEFTFDK